MNKNLKRALFILGALVYYTISTIGFALAIVNMNLASGWTLAFSLVAHIICVVPTVLIFILTFFGMLDNLGNTEEEIDEDLLLHAVINQLEADFEIKDFDAMSEMLEALLNEEQDNQDILYQYLGDTAQQNLKEGLTIKRW